MGAGKANDRWFGLACIQVDTVKGSLPQNRYRDFKASTLEKLDSIVLK
jgi:hypothetical protein